MPITFIKMKIISYLGILLMKFLFKNLIKFKQLKFDRSYQKEIFIQKLKKIKYN